jgi:uncharacterized membrane protein YvlD (DUF360 family)
MIIRYIKKNLTAIQVISTFIFAVLAPVVLAQDFNFAPSDNVKEGLNEGAQGWWVLAASLMLWFAIIVAVVCACIRPLWGYLWVPLIIFIIGYFGGGSVNIMQKHIESSSGQASIPVSQSVRKHENA